MKAIKKYKYLFIAIFLTFPQICFSEIRTELKNNDSTAIYQVAPTGDFKIIGQGSAKNWDKAESYSKKKR